MELYTGTANWQRCTDQTNPEGYVLSVVDRSGKYIYVNQGWKNLNSEDEPLGQHYSDILPNSTIGEVIRTGRPQYGYFNDGRSDSTGFFAAYIPIYEDGKIQKIAIFSVPGANIQRAAQSSGRMMKPRYSLMSIIGKSELCAALRKKIELYAPAYAPVVIEGETGTGKELIAQSLHSENGRGGPFVSVNCASIPESLFESEFFGYVEGAFTGGRRGGHTGLLEAANGGTLFLDEIHHLSPAFQAKLLRALQEKQIVPVGGVEPVEINARIICATNQSLKELVKKGEFREDLYFRLNVLSIHAPALRERPEDVPLLARYFFQQYSTLYGVFPPKVDDSVIRLLKEYDWPGNVRELQNVIERTVVCYGGLPGVLTAEHFDIDKKKERSTEPLADMATNKISEQMTMTALRELFAAEERSLLTRTMEDCGGNKSLVAKKLDISRTQLYNKLKEYGIED